MQNAFLRDFIKMRQSLHTTPVGKAPTKPVQVSGQKELTNISLATIIEKKPSSKVVLEYFRKRVDEFPEE